MVVDRGLVQRWSDATFLAQAAPVLALLRTEGADIEGADLRGMGLGLSRGRTGYHDLPLHRRVIRNTDFSLARIESTLFEASIEGSEFVECVLDGVSFSKSNVSRARFDLSSFVACTLNDATFEDVGFARTRFRDRKELGCRALRTRFVRCNWSGSQLKNVELRAAHFIECQFADARWEWCDLRGVKFVGASPSTDQLANCRT